MSARDWEVTDRPDTLKTPIVCPDIGKRENRYVSECLIMGWISSAGAFVSRFEAAFAQACGVSYGVATNFGTGALHLALEARGIGPGDARSGRLWPRPTPWSMWAQSRSLSM